MTFSLSYRYLVGQPYTWVRPKVFKARWDLITPDNSVIATYPVEKSGGWFGQRWKKAKALVPDGTGTLFLYEEGEDVVISAVEQGRRLATYQWPWLALPDRQHPRRVFLWGVVNLWGERAWRDPTRTTTYVQLSDGMFKHRVDIYPPAAEIPDELSLLLVLGIDNIFNENRAATIETGRLAGGAAGGILGQH